MEMSITNLDYKEEEETRVIVCSIEERVWDSIIRREREMPAWILYFICLFIVLSIVHSSEEEIWTSQPEACVKRRKL